MTGSRQHIQVKTLPFRIRFAFNSIIQIIEYFDGNSIGIFVIITEERRTVQDCLAHNFRSGKIVSHCFQHFIHRKAFVFKDMFLQGGEAVGYCTQPRTLYISGVITRSAVVIIASFGNTIVDKQGKECGRCIFGKHPVDIIAYTHLHIHKIMHLFHKGGV